MYATRGFRVGGEEGGASVCGTTVVLVRTVQAWGNASPEKVHLF